MSHDREATETSEKQLELNRRKIELQNKIAAVKEKKETVEKAMKSKGTAAESVV